MFKSLSHFKCIFVHGVRVCSSFIDVHAAVQFFQHHLLKRVFFFSFYILVSFVDSWLTTGVLVYFWALYSVSLICMSVCLSLFLFFVFLGPHLRCIKVPG